MEKFGIKDSTDKVIDDKDTAINHFGKVNCWGRRFNDK